MQGSSRIVRPLVRMLGDSSSGFPTEFKQYPVWSLPFIFSASLNYVNTMSSVIDVFGFSVPQRAKTIYFDVFAHMCHLADLSQANWNSAISFVGGFGWWKLKKSRYRCVCAFVPPFVPYRRLIIEVHVFTSVQHRLHISAKYIAEISTRIENVK